MRNTAVPRLDSGEGTSPFPSPRSVGSKERRGDQTDDKGGTRGKVLFLSQNDNPKPPLTTYPNKKRANEMAGTSTDEARWRRLLDTDTGRRSFSSQEPNFVHIDALGRASMVAVQKNDLLRLGARFRDLILLDPRLTLPVASVLLIRARAIVVNLAVGPSSSIRMVICENQVYVLGLPKVDNPSVTAFPTIEHPFIRRLCKCLSSNINGNQARGASQAQPSPCVELPGETVLDGKYDRTGDSKRRKGGAAFPRGSDGLQPLEDREGVDPTHAAGPELSMDPSFSKASTAFTRHERTYSTFFEVEDAEKAPYCLRALEMALTASLGLLGYEIEEFEARAYPVVDELLRQLSRKTLEAVHEVKSSIDKIQSRVERLRQELEELLEDDEDINDLYLERRATAEDWPPLPQPWEADYADKDLMTPQSPVVVGKGGGGGGVRGGREGLRRGFTASGWGRRSRGRGVRGSGGIGNPQRKETSKDREGTARSPLRRGRTGPQLAVDVSTELESSIHSELSDPDMEDESSDSEAADRALEEAEEEMLQESRERLDDVDPYANDFPYDIHAFGPVSPHQIEEAEDLLETSYVRADLLLRRLVLLDERVKDTEEFLALDLDKRRNEIVTLNVVVSALAAALGLTAAIGGIFGMNLFNVELQDNAWVLWTVLIVMVISSVLLFGLILWYMRHRQLLFVPSSL